MYTNEMSFSEFVNEASGKGRSLVQAVDAGKILYDKWYQLTYGLSNAQIAALPQFTGKSEADVSRMAYCLGVFNEMWGALHNVAVSQSDRQAYLTPML